MINQERIEREIKEKGASVVKALNEGNAELLMRDFWTSDSARFILNGRMITGHRVIKARMEESVKARKSMDLNLLEENVNVLSHDLAMHVVQFENTVISLQDSVSRNRGVWTALYQKIDTSWKVRQVHESFYPVQ